VEARIVTDRIVEEDMKDSKQAGTLYQFVRFVLWKWEVSDRKFQDSSPVMMQLRKCGFALHG
jgi:hypothetical protein